MAMVSTIFAIVVTPLRVEATWMSPSGRRGAGENDEHSNKESFHFWFPNLMGSIYIESLAVTSLPLGKALFARLVASALTASEQNAQPARGNGRCVVLSIFRGRVSGRVHWSAAQWLIGLESNRRAITLRGIAAVARNAMPSRQ